MARPKPIEVVFSAREVVAVGEPFRPWDRTFADAGVALDEMSDLRPSREPLVLRVAATGGLERERKLVEGDWLCDSDGAEPRRIPQPNWGYDGDARKWSFGRAWLDAWERCPNAQWSLYAAATAGVDRRLVVLAACACARTELPYLAREQEMSRLAIETAEAWARGEATVEEVHAASVAPASASAASAASAAYYAASDARYAYAYTASASAVDAHASLREMADLVRRQVPTIAVLRAAARR